ncbi:MAG: hypothetical protein Q9163_006111 [Psora crenata]
MAPDVPDSSIPFVPPPWTCKATVYVLPFYVSASSPLPIGIAYAPLEAKSETFASETHAGKHKGGIGFAQVIRYSDTPAGTYDELAILPGSFEAPELVNCKGKHNRITGIWVSQETTLMNGRMNWNIPKHLARFEFTHMNPKSPLPLKIEVFDPSSSHPFFTSTVHPTSYTPAFPFSSNWLRYLGLPTQFLQPPLPTGTPPEVEVGTKTWLRGQPTIESKKCKVIWWDMRQPPEDRQVANPGENEGGTLVKGENNWWPGMGRWRLGMVCDEATLEIGKWDVFDP